MRMTRCTLFAVVVAGLVALPAMSGCGDSGGNTSDTTVTDTLGGDTVATDTAVDIGTDTTIGVDTNTDTGGGGDACECGNRVCGSVGGCSCGTCDPGEACSAAGQCEAVGEPMGAYCGVTDTCNADSADWPDCINAQCTSQICLSESGVIIVNKSVCTRGCLLYKDDDQDGVNDADAPLDDCNPDDIADGPAGNAFRCVNTADIGQSPNGVCLPGTVFNTCNSDADCADGEGCDIVSTAAGVAFRCTAKQKDGAWGGSAGVGETCNNDPAAGDLALCESGFCLNGADGLGVGIGCVNRCGSGIGASTPDQEAKCDTTTAETGCDTTTNTCKGRPGLACDTDVDCSSWECTESIFTDLPASARMCWPKTCSGVNGCGGGYFCDLGIDTVASGDYGWVGNCAQEDPEGKDFGAACDADPTDELILNGGDTCKATGLCQSGFCSALCESNADCGDDATCTILEYIGDVDGDDIDDEIVPGFVCEHSPQGATACNSESDCADGETCNIFIAANPAEDVDAPYLRYGSCVPAPSGADAGYGNIVDLRGQCESGIGFELTDGTFACTEFCTTFDQCDLDDGEGGTLEGICLPQLWSWGGDYANRAVNIYAGLCLPALLFGSTGDACGTDFTCTEATEACTPFTLAGDPTQAVTTEYTCLDISDADGNMPTGAPGTACTSDYDCATGLCTSEDGVAAGYCTKLCSDTVDTCAADSMTCTDYIVYTRQGAYADNSGGYKRCEKTE